jgi:hypothetical protein
MDSNGFSAFSTFSVGRQAKRSLQESRKPVVAEMKARQAAKIRELGYALVDAGFLTLDEQSKALGLARSTTWTILTASQYTADKLAGVYGGSRTQRRKFFERVRRATPEKPRTVTGEIVTSSSARFVNVKAAFKE